MDTLKITLRKQAPLLNVTDGQAPIIAGPCSEESKAELPQRLPAKKHPSADTGEGELEELRGMIDALDTELLDILSFRLQVSAKIGQYKRRRGLAVVQPERWEKLLKSLLHKARQRGLEEGFIRSVFTLIHDYSASIQEQLIRKD